MLSHLSIASRHPTYLSKTDLPALWNHPRQSLWSINCAGLNKPQLQMKNNLNLRDRLRKKSLRSEFKWQFATTAQEQHVEAKHLAHEDNQEHATQNFPESCSLLALTQADRSAEEKILKDQRTALTKEFHQATHSKIVTHRFKQLFHQPVYFFFCERTKKYVGRT